MHRVLKTQVTPFARGTGAPSLKGPQAAFSRGISTAVVSLGGAFAAAANAQTLAEASGPVAPRGEYRGQCRLGAMKKIEAFDSRR